MANIETKNKLIPVYYIYDTNTSQITIAGKDYADSEGQFADGPNGENGKVYPENKNEPYSYFKEINETMWSIDCPEDAEGVFDTNGHTLEYIMGKMQEKGFEMIEYK